MKVKAKFLIITILISSFIVMFFHNESFAVPDYGEPGSYNTAFSIDLVCESLENYEIDMSGDYGYETRVYSENILDEDFYVKIASLVDMGETIETSSFGILNYTGTEELSGRNCYIYTADIIDKMIFENKIVEDLRYPEYNFKFYYEISFREIEIEVKDVNNLSVDIDTSNKEYTGQKIELDIVIKDEVYTLLEGTDYIVEYSGNINVGVATVTITGIGNYKGSIEKFFEIISNDNGFAGGTGKIEDPYLISTPEQLYAIKNDLAASYKLINDIDLTYDTTNESGLFYNEGKGWISIGANDEVFSGVLDGNNKKIIGLNQNKTNSRNTSKREDSQGGLFSHVSGEVINLILQDVSLSYVSETNSNYYNIRIGGLTAYLSGTIKNIRVSGMIKYTGKDYADVGGVCGYIACGNVIDCINYINITSESERYTGGIAGEISGEGRVIDAKNYGNIKGKQGAAGIVEGMSNQSNAICSVSGCVNYGNIIADYPGGIVSSMAGNCSITMCANYGDITANNLGGGIASLVVFSGMDTRGYIEKSMNAGKISTYASAGGIVGSTVFEINDCYNIGNIYDLGDGTTKEHIGGIAGRTGGVEDVNVADLNNTYNIGVIISSNKRQCDRKFSRK